MQLLTTYDVNLFGIKMTFDSVAFTLPIGDGWDIYWYGICIATGFLLAIIYCFNRAKRFGVNVDALTDVALVTTPLAILCARLYYVIFYPGKLEIKSIWDFFGVSSGSGVAGLAIYGGVIGATVFGFIMCKIRKVNILDAFDLAASGFFIGQAIGRWGNFFNQEAFGSLTNFGMMSNGVAEYIANHKIAFGLGEVSKSEMLMHLEENGLFVHPTFLYESILCVLGFILLHFLGKNRKFKGQLALTYGAWYGLGRMFIEGLRTDSLYLGPLKVSQWLSGGLLMICVILLIYNFYKLREKKNDLTYQAMFNEVDSATVKGVAYYEGEEAEATEETVETIEETQTEPQKEEE